MGQIIIPSAIPTLTVGGRVFTDLANLIILRGAARGTTSVRCSMRAPNGTAGYQVTTGKTLKIFAVRAEIGFTAVAAVSEAVKLAYSDNDLGLLSSTAMTNGVYEIGAGNGSSIGAVSNTAVCVFESATSFSVPAAKYPAFEVMSSSVVQCTLTVYGYEV